MLPGGVLSGPWPKCHPTAAVRRFLFGKQWAYAGSEEQVVNITGAYDEDGVAAANVLEHMPEALAPGADPTALLQKVAREMGSSVVAAGLQQAMKGTIIAGRGDVSTPPLLDNNTQTLLTNLVATSGLPSSNNVQLDTNTQTLLANLVADSGLSDSDAQILLANLSASNMWNKIDTTAATAR